MLNPIRILSLPVLAALACGASAQTIVQIKERLARPAAAEVDPAAVDLDETLAECHDAGSTAAGS